MTQCQGTTQEGKRCGHKAREDTAYCQVHTPKDLEPVKEYDRKVIHLCHVNTIGSGLIVALCDDGTLWQRYANGDKWDQMRGPDDLSPIANSREIRDKLQYFLDPDGDQEGDFRQVVDILREGGIRI